MNVKIDLGTIIQTVIAALLVAIILGGVSLHGDFREFKGQVLQKVENNTQAIRAVAEAIKNGR